MSETTIERVPGRLFAPETLEHAPITATPARKKVTPPPSTRTPGRLFSQEVLEEYGVLPKSGPFLKRYTSDQIKEDKILVLDLETTCRHPGEPVVVKSSTALGGSWASTVGKYLKNRVGTIDMTPRARVISLFGEKTGVKSWDLDHVPSSEALALIQSTIDGKTLIGHNISFDLMWVWYTAHKLSPGSWEALAPAFVLDTSLLLRMRSVLLFDGLSDAAKNTWVKKQLKKLFSKDNPRVSMEAAVTALKLGTVDKSFQKPQNWGLSVLDEERYGYVTGDVTTPLEILWHVANSVSAQRSGPVFKKTDTEDMIVYLRHIWPWLDDYSSAMIVSARMGRRGVPIDREYAKNLEAELRGKFDMYAEALLTSPFFSDPEIAAVVRNTKKGEPTLAQKALIAHIESLGGVVGKTDKGKPALGDDALALAGFAKDPVCINYMERRRYQRYLKTVAQWRAYSEVEGDGRIHPSLAHRAMSLRESSESPNGQNPPREEWFRHLVKSRPGYKMISVDFSAIELRIGAALAVRALTKFTAALKSPEPPIESMKWLWKDLRNLILSGEVVGRPTKPDSEDPSVTWEHWRDYYVQLVAHLYPRAQALPAKNALIKIGDLHLVTALGFVKGFPLEGKTPVEYLAACTKERRKELKTQLADQRQTAKAANFGTLYGAEARALWEFGIISYGLTWTLEEAAQVRSLWLSLYPDYELWQVLTKLAPARKAFEYWTEDGIAAEPGKLWYTATLSGRVSVSPRITNALNSQDQGTGGDMLARLKAQLWTIKKFRETVEPWVVLAVHDEMLCEAPEDRAEEVMQALSECMVEAGEKFLKPYGIPVEVEGGLSEHWKH